jgi:hypothetical protein
MYIGLRVKYPLFSSDCNEFGQIFEKSSNIKFHRNPYSGSRVVPCGQADMTNLIVAFRSFVNAPKILTKRAMAHRVNMLLSLSYYGPVSRKLYQHEQPRNVTAGSITAVLASNPFLCRLTQVTSLTCEVAWRTSFHCRCPHTKIDETYEAPNVVGTSVV